MPFDPARAKALFLDALERLDPAERAGFLDRECGEDADLRHRVDQLLAAYDQPAAALEVPQEPVPTPLTEINLDPGPTGMFDNSPPVEVERTASLVEKAEPRDLIGSIIAGRYKLRQEIGEGGMGRVYLAEQLQPVKRQVALKLIKPGMDSRTVLARFESERQALALMDHPHIAKVLDAGTTEHGRPFFVMELVKGIPLTEYCDRHQLDLPTRLAIFRQICSAVQHAHQKGIIHRDLKPTNILVESHDGKPVPKVIDFGLAKATSGMQLSEHSLFTAFGSVTGTPMYMAPEQATFNALDVDTRADIYALGVILYELLTGSTPIQRGTLERAALDEMLRVIREVEPPTPSSRISTSEGLPSLAAARHVEPARLSRLVRGDLDWIVMKALAKERDRRYDSAIGLANDVERYLNHEPVSAGPPTAAYRMRKFVRRNRGQVAAAALVLLVLVVGIVGTTLALIEADTQRQRAIAEAKKTEKARQAETDQRQQAERRLVQIERANEILNSIFNDLNPRFAAKEGKPLAVLLGEWLDQATAQIQGEESGDPLTVARMQRSLGESQLGLGFPQKAIDLFIRCRSTFASKLGPDHPDTLICMDRLALAYLGVFRPDLALPIYEKASTLRQAKLGSDHPDTFTSKLNLAYAYLAASQTDRALPLFEEILALAKARFGPDHLTTLCSMGSLAKGYERAAKLDRALPLFEETLALMKAKLGPDNTLTFTSQLDLAYAYLAASRTDRALLLFEETLAMAKASLSPDHPITRASMGSLAFGYQTAGQPVRAASLYEEILAFERAKLGPDHPDTLNIMERLAVAYQSAVQPDRARSLLRELADSRRRQAGSNSWQYAGALASLGQELLQQKMWFDAEPVAREALAIRERNEADLWSTFNTKSLLGGALLGQKKYAEAEPLLRAGYEGMKQRAEKIPPAAKPRLMEALDRLIAFGEATGKADEVKAWKAERSKMTAEAPKSP